MGTEDFTAAGWTAWFSAEPVSGADCAGAGGEVPAPGASGFCEQPARALIRAKPKMARERRNIVSSIREVGRNRVSVTPSGQIGLERACKRKEERQKEPHPHAQVDREERDHKSRQVERRTEDILLRDGPDFLPIRVFIEQASSLRGIAPEEIDRKSV